MKYFAYLISMPHTKPKLLNKKIRVVSWYRLIPLVLLQRKITVATALLINFQILEVMSHFQILPVTSHF